MYRSHQNLQSNGLIKDMSTINFLKIDNVSFFDF
jgi:hypothetical protein